MTQPALTRFAGRAYNQCSDAMFSEIAPVQITINGELRDMPEATTVAALLDALSLQPQRVAVERNREIVRRATFNETILTDGDRLEIVTLVGGG